MSAQGWATLAAVTVPVLALVGVIYAAHLGKKGTDRTAVLQERATDLQERATLLAPYSQALADLTAELERQRADSSRDRERSAEDRKRIAALEDTTDELTQRLGRAEDRYRIAIRFIKEQVAWVSQRMPGVHDAPRVPAVLEADLEE